MVCLGLASDEHFVFRTLRVVFAFLGMADLLSKYSQLYRTFVESRGKKRGFKGKFSFESYIVTSSVVNLRLFGFDTEIISKHFLLNWCVGQAEQARPWFAFTTAALVRSQAVTVLTHFPLWLIQL